jgi:predicted dehydrogenase
MSDKILRAAVIGMGGFARLHQESIRELERAGLVQLVATCDPRPEQFEKLISNLDLAGRGVRIHTDYREMLEAHGHELDFVTVPTPIPLHAPMHRACVERGLACYLEKPPTLSWRELDDMLRVEQAAKFSSNVGFNFIIEAERQALKRRLLAGEFGAPLRGGFLGYWPRPESYFTRASWAGSLTSGNHLILDSCTGNAMAHYIHNLLFWCGQDELLSWGEVETVEAELYRAHAIESFDTCFARGTCAGGIEFLVGATHAGAGSAWHREWLECENAVITYTTRGEGYLIEWRDGRVEREATTDCTTGEFLRRNLEQYARYLRGEEPRPLNRLEDTRPFVYLNDLLFVASGQIATVPEEYVERGLDRRGEATVAIQDLEAHLENFARSGSLPSGMDLPWAQPGGRAVAADLEQLETVVRRIQNARGGVVVQ